MWILPTWKPMPDGQMLGRKMCIRYKGFEEQVLPTSWLELTSLKLPVCSNRITGRIIANNILQTLRYPSWLLSWNMKVDILKKVYRDRFVWISVSWRCCFRMIRCKDLVEQAWKWHFDFTILECIDRSPQNWSTKVIWRQRFSTSLSYCFLRNTREEIFQARQVPSNLTHLIRLRRCF